MTLRRIVRSCRTIAALVALTSVSVQSAVAGPPFSTDSAATIEPGHTEIDVYAETTHVHGYTSATLPGVQIDHGVWQNTQVRVVLPVTLAAPAAQTVSYGGGDIQVGIKQRIVGETDGAWWPQVSVFPLVLVPTGRVKSGLGQGKPSFALPLWLEKQFGTWKVYGGGGYSFESGPRGRNWPFFGVSLTRAVSDQLTLGASVFHREPSQAGAVASTNLTFGGSYDFNSLYHLYFSAGRGLQNARQTSLLSLYTAVAITF